MENQKGVTLIEVLAAFTLLAVILMAYLNIIGTTRLATKQSDQSTTALAYAEQVVNAIQLNPTSAEIAQYHDKLNVVNQQTFHTYIQQIPYTTSEITVSPDPAMKTQRVSVPTIIYATLDRGKSPYLITVTVSWD